MKLYVPGPISVDEEVAKSTAREMIGHRGKEFQEIFGKCTQGLKKVFLTNNRVLISTSSGTGLMEGAIRNCVKEKVLMCSCGAFGKKWIDIAKACGKQVDVLTAEEGKAISKEALKEKLAQANLLQEQSGQGKYEAVCITHNETSTGVTNNLAELVPIIKEHGALVLVDAVSSAAGSRIPVDELNLDICLTSSQKCFGLPPGLSFVVVSEKALEKSKTIKDKGYYFDFVELAKEYDTNQTPYTPAVGLIFGLKKVIEDIETEGIENRFKRHEELAKQCQEWAIQNGFELFAEEGKRSNTVTAVSNTKDIDLEELKKRVKAKGFVMDAGYKKLNETLKSQGRKETFRIPHMGSLRKEEFQKYLDCLSEEIKAMRK